MVGIIIGIVILVAVVTVFITLAVRRRTHSAVKNDLLLRNLPLVATIFTKDFITIDCSDTVTKIFKIQDKKEYINDFYKFSPEFQPCGNRSKDVVHEKIKLIEEGNGITFNWIHLDSEGNELQMEVMFFKTRFKGERVYVAYAKDITELLLSQKAVEVAQTRMRLMYETAPIRIALWDERFEIIEANFMTLSTFGQQSTENATKKMFDYMPPTQPCGTESKVYWNEMLQKVLDEEKHQFSLVCISPEGMLIHMDVIGASIKIGNQTMIGTYAQDITPLIKSVQQMAASDENNRAKSRFLARMSHEIRTPLAAVLSISEIYCKKQNLAPDISEAFTRIFKSGSDLLNIVNDILDLSRIEAGKMTIINEVFDVARLIYDVSQLNIVAADNKNLRFEIDVSENIPSHVVGDELRIKQVLNNVLANAVKYTSEGTVSFIIKSENIPDTDKTNLILTVKDMGSGMTKEQVNLIFNEYTRFDDRRMPGTSGTGLGMPITIDLLKLMGGSVNVDSTPGAGTTVTVCLPCLIAGDELIGENAITMLKNYKQDNWEADKRSEHTPLTLPGRSVLIVDDLDVNLYIAKELLEPYRLDIYTCDNAISAINLIEGGETFDIILMDHMMPGIDGVKATHTLRKLGYKKPIVALTANALVGQAETFMSIGFDAFLSKPINTAELHNVIATFITNLNDTEPTSQADVKIPDLDEYLQQPEVVKQISESFLEIAPTSIANINQYIEEGRFEAAANVAHTLKSMAKYMKNDILAQASALAEIDLNNGEEPPPGVMENIRAEIVSSLEMIMPKN